MANRKRPQSSRDPFGARLKALRQARQLTRESLAEKANRSAESIAKLERGERLPSYEVLVDLCHALAVDPTDLFPPMDARKVTASRRATEERCVAKLKTLSDRDLQIVANLLDSMG